MGIETDPALLGRAFTEKRTVDALLRQFRKQIEPMVKSGVEVIIPAGRLATFQKPSPKALREFLDN